MFDLFDQVRVVSTPLTQNLNFAGLNGQVYGFTTPSASKIDVVGELTTDIAFNVQLEGQSKTIWFVPELLEFVSPAPVDTEVVIGNKRLVRSESGEWIDESSPMQSFPRSRKPWWRFW